MIAKTVDRAKARVRLPIIGSSFKGQSFIGEAPATGGTPGLRGSCRGEPVMGRETHRRGTESHQGKPDDCALTEDLWRSSAVEHRKPLLLGLHLFDG
jgi:hypothetical protein